VHRLGHRKGALGAAERRRPRDHVRVTTSDAVPVLHREVWQEAAGRPVRALVSGARRDGVPEVVLMPGLGAPGYMLDLLHACGAWTRARLLDLPGFGSPRTAGCPPELDVLTSVAAAYLDGAAGPVLLAGHSTGAQLALRTAVAAPSRVGALALLDVTFDPPVRRSPLRLAARLRTYLRERPRELAVTVPTFVRAGAGLPRYVRSALADEPERHLPAVAAPVLVLRGRHDALCPPEWAADLARGARLGRLVTVPGAHNTPYTHPGAIALHLGALAQDRTTLH
jgi:pimeloyl-ACP methyl ester carboxylesterase